jgi:hypothetical protein
VSRWVGAPNSDRSHLRRGHPKTTPRADCWCRPILAASSRQPAVQRQDPSPAPLTPAPRGRSRRSRAKCSRSSAIRSRSSATHSRARTACSRSSTVRSRCSSSLLRSCCNSASSASSCVVRQVISASRRSISTRPASSPRARQLARRRSISARSASSPAASRSSFAERRSNSVRAAFPCRSHDAAASRAASRSPRGRASPRHLVRRRPPLLAKAFRAAGCARRQLPCAPRDDRLTLARGSGCSGGQQEGSAPARRTWAHLVDTLTAIDVQRGSLSLRGPLPARWSAVDRPHRQTGERCRLGWPQEPGFLFGRAHCLRVLKRPAARKVAPCRAYRASTDKEERAARLAP